MFNAQQVDPVNLQNLEDLLQHVIDISRNASGNMAFKVSRMAYERDALTNLIGEAGCVINEARQRLKYLDELLSQEV